MIHESNWYRNHLKINHINEFKTGVLYRFINPLGHRGILEQENFEKNCEVVENGEIFLFLGREWQFSNFKIVHKEAMKIFYKGNIFFIFLNENFCDQYGIRYNFYKIEN